MNLIIVLAALTGTATVILLVSLVISSGSRVTSARLRELSPTPEPARQVTPVGQGRREDSLPFITRVLSGHGITESIYTELAAAGIPLRPSEFVGIIIGAVIVSQLVAFVVAPFVLGHLLLGIVAAAIPFLVLKVMQQKRRAAFDAQIVDALVMIASSLRSGFSFLRAMQMVAKEMPPPISKEFERAINEMNVGRPMEDALRGIVSRVQSYDFDLVVTAVLIQHQVGGNLADILETIAATIRERMRIMGEIRALTAEGRMSGIILVLLPITLGIFLTISRPEYMSVLVTEKIGHFMIGIALVAQAIGGLIINKMLQVDI